VFHQLCNRDGTTQGHNIAKLINSYSDSDTLVPGGKAYAEYTTKQYLSVKK